MHVFAHVFKATHLLFESCVWDHLFVAFVLLIQKIHVLNLCKFFCGLNEILLIF